jgi:hypothetical protein
MSNKSLTEARALSKRDSNSLPAPASDKTIEICQQINRAFVSLADAAHDANWTFGVDFDNYPMDGHIEPANLTPQGWFKKRNDPKTVVMLRHALDDAETMLDAWHEVDRRATRGETAMHMTLLLACFPANSRTQEDRYAFERLLTIDVADSQPTLFELQEACTRVRRTHPYPTLQIADLIQALEPARKRALEIRLHLAAIPYMRQALEQERE